MLLACCSHVAVLQLSALNFTEPVSLLKARLSEEPCCLHVQVIGMCMLQLQHTLALLRPAADPTSSQGRPQAWESGRQRATAMGRIVGRPSHNRDPQGRTL
jgi:hypothetical protein